MEKLVTYIRVSTQKQGGGGLGLEGQKAAILAHVKGVAGEIVAEYQEIESGKRSERPQLAQAIAHAKRIKGKLIIAKLDRLARNVAFVAALMESKVDFVACDNPHANKLTLHILAAIAEHEAEQISERTKAALAAAKQRGVKLGSNRSDHRKGREQKRREGGLKGSRAAQRKRETEAEPVYKAVSPIISQLRENGSSYQQIANYLNDLGHTTVRGLPWNPMQVSRVSGGFS